MSRRFRPGGPGAYLLVGAGGAVGGGLRYLLSVALDESAGGFPTATLIVNIIGSFLIGGLVIGLTGPGRWPAWTRPALGTGLLGGFTTFSAVSHGVDRIAADSSVLLAGGVLALLLATGLAAAVAGVATGSQLAMRSGPR